MSDMNQGETPPARSEVRQQAERKKGNGLSFPSVAFMGIAIFIVILMMVLTGWKIVNLGNEKAQIDTERRLLERDKLAYTKILEELPGLEDKRQNLLRELNELSGKVQSNQTVMTSLITQVEAARSDLEKDRATNKQIREETKAARETLATLQGEIRTKSKESENLKQEVGARKEEEKTLKTKSDNLQKEISKLQADISGLERQKLLFDDLSKENSNLTSVSKRFLTIADSLEAAQKSTENTIQGWKTQNQYFTQAINELQRDIQNFSKQTQALSTDFGNLTTANKELQGSLKALIGDLQSAAKTLNGGANQIQKLMETLDRETQRLSKSVDGSTNNLQGVLSTFSKEIKDLGKAVSTINGHASSFQANITSVEGATAKFLETSKELPSLKELISKLQAVDQALKLIEKRLPQEPAGEKGQ